MKLIGAALVSVLALGASAAPTDPVEAFAARVILEPGLSAAQETVLRAAVRDAASTPTGREYAARFVAGGWTVRLGTATLGLAPVEALGRPSVTGVAGGFDARSTPPLVRIDAVLLSSAPETVFDTVAHEILGHGLSYFEAKKAGVDAAWNQAAEDEMLAELVGDAIMREKGRPLDSSNLSAFELLKGTEPYAHLQWFGLSGYADRFTLEDAANPGAALEARLDAQAAEYDRLEKVRNEIRLWRRRIVHFTGVHHEPVENYTSLWAYVDDMEAANDEHRTSLAGAREIVYDALRFLAVPDGLNMRRELAQPRFAAFVRARREDIRVLRERLIALGATEELPAVAGRVSHTDDAWAVLLQKVDEDKKKNPDHWR